ETSQTVLLKGDNGSGKTTLCRILTGLEKEFSGTVKLDSENLQELSNTLIADKIFYLQQGTLRNIIAATPNDDLAIWQHKFNHDDTEKLQNEREKALKYFCIDKIKQKPLWELSNGQIKRIGLAAMLLNTDKYFILDEQTSGLDEKLLNLLIAVLKNHKKKNLGALIISHKQRIFDNLADKTLQIENKQVFEK
ncbi:MAG: ATP-binding cassette domain-containing protein, partial [Candidatus Cloacimonetes bacterium]|nr:ATP-binding cassette domain-containing protein [Candidatus Cloacimonadota bacterium]